MTGNDIRRQFLKYFEKHDHRIVRSSSLVPSDDPTLLFVNAGMVQFKRTFLGEEKRDYSMATTSQKCVRAGGKHNDLENVGYTARHHTFFEMLGNFSFGDYFKEKALDFAWDLLTNGYGLPADKLWVSIYLDDDEAADLWHTNIGVPRDRIVRFGEADNFWAMGDTGPCGPCSEIHIDRGDAHGCGRPDCKLGCECDRFLEIWNLVFMQFNRDGDGTLTPLPKPSIDTGMGLERIVSLLQDVSTNYETDLILPIMKKVEDLSGYALGDNADADVAMKVIADHSRAAAFLIGDGVLPSNDGRGYVLRRIMRRAIRYGRNIGLIKPFLHDTARVVFEIMRDAYPDLREAETFITSVIRNEENRFSETLDNGLRLLNDELAELRAKGENRIPGHLIFKLYDTFGFPVDIVRDVVRDSGMLLDMDGFDAAMTVQKEKSRSVASFSNLSDAYKNFSADGNKSVFKGYEDISLESTVSLIVKDNVEVGQASAGSRVEIVTGETPFYAESGGQVGDCGVITSAGGLHIDVFDTAKDPTGLIIHKGDVTSGTLAKGDTVLLCVDAGKRGATERNHTATHILHAVLRSELGDHVKQAGSMVSPDRMRFDFTHFSQIETETLNRIEALVNDCIRANMETGVVEMAAEEAFQSGAMALFEEKYGDRVRVVSLESFSKELCGGTHTQKTGNIGLFKLVSESSIASGVRRIEAVTGAVALEYVQHMNGILQDASRLLRDKPEKLPERIEKMVAEQKRTEKEIQRLKGKIAAMSAADDDFKTVKGVQIIARKVAVDNPSGLRDLADQLRDRLGSGIVVLGSAADSKALLIAVVTKDLTDRFHAGNIIREVAARVGGSGGGRPDMAQAGGTQPEKLDEALAAVYDIVDKG